MKSTIILLSFLAAAVFFVSCASIDLATYEDENLYAELDTSDPAMVTLLVVNRQNREFELDRDGLSYTGNGTTLQMSPMVSSRTGASPASLTVPPNARLRRSFVPDRLIQLEGGKPVVPQWVPEKLEGSVFRFAYKAPEGEKEIVFPDNQQRRLLGTVKITNDTVFPAFKSVEERRKKLYDLAHAQALSSYGPRVKLVNLRYDSAKGFFKESSTLDADVIEAE